MEDEVCLQAAPRGGVARGGLGAATRWQVNPGFLLAYFNIASWGGTPRAFSLRCDRRESAQVT